MQLIAPSVLRMAVAMATTSFRIIFQSSFFMAIIILRYTYYIRRRDFPFAAAKVLIPPARRNPRQDNGMHTFYRDNILSLQTIIEKTFIQKTETLLPQITQIFFYSHRKH